MEVAPGIYSLGQKQGGRVHAYLLDDGEGVTVVDTLMAADAHLILEELARIGRAPGDIKHLIQTHAHRSHLGGLARLRELSGAPVYAHEWEADIISADRVAQPVSSRPYNPVRTWPLQIGLNLNVSKHPPVKVDQYIHDGDRIGPLTVVYSPGHSPGHLAFYWPERRLLIAGDAVCTWPSFMLGWRGFLLNVKQHRESVRRLADLDTEILCVGHGEPLATGGAERIRAALPELDRVM
jgi:glyoxylase-like metal-dependent hydrolase (beta-lactamase superfamily II)